VATAHHFNGNQENGRAPPSHAVDLKIVESPSREAEAASLIPSHNPRRPDRNHRRTRYTTFDNDSSWNRRGFVLRFHWNTRWNIRWNMRRNIAA
jgi:hypothetical protein